MSARTYELIERMMIEASMKGCRIHWGQIFAHSKEYLGTKEKQEIKKIADKWGVEIIDK